MARRLERTRTRAAGELLAESQLANPDIDSKADYWAHYVQGSFQGPAFIVAGMNKGADADPDNELAQLGIVGAFPNGTPPPPPAPIDIGRTTGTLIHGETLRDRGGTLPKKKYTTVHECAHQFGLVDSDEIMAAYDGEAPTTDHPWKFSAAHLRILRIRKFPRGGGLPFPQPIP